jgi:hypothetical protein
MDQKQSYFEPLHHKYKPIGDASSAKFQTVEELLEAGSGASFYLQPWCILGMPAFLQFPDKSI